MSFKDMKLRYKVGVGVVTGAAVVSMAGGAFAYFTSSGAGTGTASVGTSTPFVITGTDSSANYPGQTTTVNLSVYNPGGGSQKIGTIHLASVKACDSTSNYQLSSASNNNTAGCYKAGDTAGTPTGTELNALNASPGCESLGTAGDGTSDWYMADVTENQDIPAGATYSGTSLTHLTNATGTLGMNDLASSQDVCKNANLTLIFSAAAPSS